MGMATCRTPECGNEGTPIDVGPPSFEMDGEEWPRGVVICGVCGNEISDITEEENAT